jgi:hypothetical protein
MDEDRKGKERGRGSDMVRKRGINKVQQKEE